MQELIKDFTPFFSEDRYKVLAKDIQEQIGYLLSLLNTHNIITQGGVSLYKEKKAYEAIEVDTGEESTIPDHVAVSVFIGTTLSNMANEAFNREKELRDISSCLYQFNPEDEASCTELERVWLENQEFMQNLIYLYSEYLFRVFLQDPFEHEQLTA